MSTAVGGTIRPCPECGAQIPVDERFTVWCASCDWNVDPGERQKQQEQQQKQETRKKRRGGRDRTGWRRPGALSPGATASGCTPR
ncbi:hypothetical protein ACFPC0_06750 [Streptomyces andamanensis]|uniref:Uncharacterized protein n=1 Tax=Streptomyces andamanensis TaxID=1565035 RepID=A0ABV8TAC7_9ACTN